MTKQYSVLIVEDEKIYAHLSKESLEAKGFNVIEAGDGKDGFKKALQVKPNIIVLDIVLPKMDGITMFKELRKDKWGEKVPIIFVTSLSNTSRLKELEDDHTNIYLIKNECSFEDLANITKEVCEMLKVVPDNKFTVQELMQKAKKKYMG